MKYEVTYEHTACCQRFFKEQIIYLYDIIQGAVAVPPVYCAEHGAELRIVNTRVMP